jgi:hypothetical protein
MSIQDIRTVNDYIVAVSIALSENSPDELLDLHDVIQDWMIDDETRFALETLFEAAQKAVWD